MGKSCVTRSRSATILLVDTCLLDISCLKHLKPLIYTLKVHLKSLQYFESTSLLCFQEPLMLEIDL